MLFVIVLLIYSKGLLKLIYKIFALFLHYLNPFISSSCLFPLWNAILSVNAYTRVIAI